MNNLKITGSLGTRLGFMVGEFINLSFSQVVLVVQ